MHVSAIVDILPGYRGTYIGGYVLSGHCSRQQMSVKNEGCLFSEGYIFTGVYGNFKAGPLDLSFWSFLTFLHHGIEEVEKHLLWKFHKKIRRKSWSNVPPKLLACIRFYTKLYTKSALQKFNRAREIEFNFFVAWTIFMKLGTLVHHVHGCKRLPQIF